MTDKIANSKTAAPAKKLPASKVTASKASANTVAPKTLKAAPADKNKAKKDKNADTKVKLVRDSFSMPKGDFAKIAELKELCLKSGMQVKKSELLRAGLHALGKLSAAQLKSALSDLDKIDTGKPKKD